MEEKKNPEMTELHGIVQNDGDKKMEVNEVHKKK